VGSELRIDGVEAVVDGVEPAVDGLKSAVQELDDLFALGIGHAVAPRGRVKGGCPSSIARVSEAQVSLIGDGD